MDNLNTDVKGGAGKVVVMGFAIFALFFGAGNLIFPPYLGLLTGDQWPTAFIGFAIGDVCLGVAAMVATLKDLRSPLGIWSRVGTGLSIALGSVFFIFNGALFPEPRTCATAYELGIKQMFPGFSTIIWSIIFFGLTWAFAIKPTKVIDYVGKILTPLLILLMVILEVKGVFMDIGIPRETAIVDSLFKEGLTQGYLTMDSCAGITSAYVALAAAIGYGYKKEKDIQGFVAKSCILGAVILALLYLGLTVLGAKVAGEFDASIEQTALLVLITERVLGSAGKYILGILAILACLTTAIGIVSSAATYFTRITKGKISYNLVITVFLIFSAISAVIGVKGLIAFFGPVLNLFYPALITGVILTLFTNQIKNDWVFKGCTYVAVAMGICNFLGLGFVSHMPLAREGLEWFVPVAITFVIMMIVTRNKPSEGWHYNDGNDVIESYEDLVAKSEN